MTQIVFPARIFNVWKMLKDGGFNKRHMVNEIAHPNLKDRELVLQCQLEKSEEKELTKKLNKKGFTRHN